MTIAPTLSIMRDRSVSLVDHFAAYQQGRGFSPKTIKRRTNTLQGFQRSIAPSDLSDATTEDIAEYLLRYPSPRTRHAYRSDLSTFYKWALRRKLVTHDPTELIDPIRVPKSLPRPVPAELVPDLVLYAPNRNVRLMVALAAYAGLRVMEISQLEAEDIDITHRVLMVRNGKGGKDRVVPLHPLLCQLLAPEVRKPGRLFQAKPDTVGRMVANYLRDRGIESTAHKLRATFATSVATAAQGNVVMVQRLLGHGSPTTTMAYVGWDGGDAVPFVTGLYA